MGDILKEAIADAKAVRETALQNAKMALEEAFTPQLKSMLSAKLKEDEFEDEEEIGGEEEFGGEEVPAEVPAEEEPEEGYYGEDEEGGEEEIPAEEPVFGDEEGGEEDELDLEAIIRELEQEIAMEQALGEGDKEAYDEKEPSDDANHVGGTIGESDSGYDRGESDPDNPAGSGSQMTEDEDVEIDESILDEDEDEDKDKEEVDEEVDESSGIGKGTGRGNTDRSSGIGSGGSSTEETKLESVQAELKEYKEAVSFLKDKLHEVNILNAKLLFTNKLFKEFALDNNQKLRVVETFDRAQSTREIKLVYSTLAEQFNDNGSINRKKSISESASSAVASTKPSKESTKVITEETQVADRFRKLAGLIK